MTIQYTDQGIQDFIKERKVLPRDYAQRMQLKHKQGHNEQQLDAKGERGNLFRIILRQNRFNVLDFSAICALCLPNSNKIFRLQRCNGKSHEHTNTIEDRTFYGFHIHRATERYQELGMTEDSFAEMTDAFNDFVGARRCLLRDCNFIAPDDDQGKLFEEV